VWDRRRGRGRQIVEAATSSAERIRPRRAGAQDERVFTDREGNTVGIEREPERPVESADRRVHGDHLAKESQTMIILGLVLLLVGLLTGVGILWSLGVLLIIIGAILWILGAAGREVGGRRHYY